jgi:LysM repeat protein
MSAVSKENTVSAGHPVAIHVVKAGDTLTRIARSHRTTVKAIEMANGLASDRIAIGTILKLPEI